MCFAEQEQRPISSVPISVTEAEMCRQCLEFMKILFATFCNVRSDSTDCNVHSDLRRAFHCEEMPTRSNQWEVADNKTCQGGSYSYTVYTHIYVQLHTHTHTHTHTHMCIDIHTQFWLYTAVSGRTDWIRQITTTTPRAPLLLESGADQNIEYEDSPNVRGDNDKNIQSDISGC